MRQRHLKGFRMHWTMKREEKAREEEKRENE